MSIYDAISSTVVFLFAGKPPKPIGTGFIVGIPLPNDSAKYVPVVVTAKHVLGNHDTVFARFSWTGEKSIGMAEYDIGAQRAHNDYWEHPDNGVDIAVFRTRHFKEASYQPLPLEMIATKEAFADEDVKVTDRVIFPALLVNFMGMARNYPVMRDGTIALIPDEPVAMQYKVGTRTIQTAQEVILLDAISIPGASGAPIFLWAGPRIKKQTFAVGGTKLYVLGIMHGFYPAIPRDLIEAETATTQFMYAENSGVAIMFPSWRLREILDLDEFKQRISAIEASEDDATPATKH